jgi:diaminopimelate decarboxylase
VGINDYFIVKPFLNKNGILYIYDINLVELSEKKGTPLLVTSEERLENNYFSIYNSFKNFMKISE